MKKFLVLNNLKALLRFKNISYGELSEVIGISKGTISEKINNRKNRSFTTLEIIDICKYLDIKREDLYKYFFES